MTLLGTSVSISAIVFSYGVSGSVEAASSKSLALVLGDATIWVVPGSGVGLDAHTGLIVPNGSISEDTIRLLERKSPDADLTRVIAGPVVFMDTPAVVYGDEREKELAGLAVSSDLWRDLNGKHEKILIDQNEVERVVVRPSLPPRTIVTSLKEAKRLLRVRDGASWLLSHYSRPLMWARGFADSSDIRITNNPVIEQTDGDLRATVYLIEGSVARFDPFSFKTKFSALVINSSMSTLFGIVARLIFLLGIAVAVTSASIGLQERRDEIAVFAVTGLEENVILLFLAEACVTQILCFVLGSVIGLVMLYLAIQNKMSAGIAGQALAFGVIYMPTLIVLTALVPSQSVANRRPVELVRRNI